MDVYFKHFVRVRVYIVFLVFSFIPIHSFLHYFSCNVHRNSKLDRKLKYNLLEYSYNNSYMSIPFEKSLASNPKSIFWSKNNKKKTSEVRKSSKKKYLFDCEKCVHEFESRLSDITNGSWCGFCANKQLCNNEKCKICLEKSFASNPKCIFWSDKNDKIPSECYKSSGSKYLFDCKKCGHEFESRLSDITRGGWCGFCANKQLCNNEKCKICLEKSFASNSKCIFWSSKNDKTPREMFKSSDSNCLFDCDKCGHEFESALYHITNMNSWCGFCANKKLCDNEDCKTCFNKSFLSHPKSIFWSSKNGTLKPREVFKSSMTKCLFVCEKLHEFESSLNSISNMGSWCPKCVNKTETKLYELIIPFYPSMIIQYKQDWCKNKQCLPFDFCIPEDNIIIELDGNQHFKQVSNWQSPEENFENDKYKENCANENGYSTIRIIQEDVWNDKYDWCKELCEAIENIKNVNKIVNIYLCKNGEYDKFNP